MLRRAWGGISALSLRGIGIAFPARPLTTTTTTTTPTTKTDEELKAIIAAPPALQTAPGQPSVLAMFLSGITALWGGKPSVVAPREITPALEQQVKELIYGMYKLLNAGDVAGANKFAANYIFSIVNVEDAIQISNNLFLRDKEFRKFIIRSIDASIHKLTPHIKYSYISPDHRPVPIFEVFFE